MIATRGGIEVPWGRNDHLTLDLPEQWNLLGVLEPNPIPPLPDPDAAIEEALAKPIGSLRVGELAIGARRVAILIDDLSRPTPAHLMLPHIIAELETAGVPRNGIVLVMALGTHRPMNASDVAAKVGPFWADQIRWENHDYANHAANVRLGRTRRGTEVYVNATVVAADLVISLGVIEPHVIAGFGGGYKNLIPGVAGAATIAATHTLNLTPQTYNMVGPTCDSNPMRLDLEEGGAMLRRRLFILNVVLDTDLRPVRFVAGHPVDAHREGTKTSGEMYGVRVPKQADVLITTSYPMDIDLRQGLKALANTIGAARPGGLVIDLIRAEEGVGHMQAGSKLALPRSVVKKLAPTLLKVLPARRGGGQGEEFKFFTYFGLQALLRNDLLLYAPYIPKEFAAGFPIAEFAWSLDDVWRSAERRFPDQADVLVIPAGGVTFPIVDAAT